MTKKDTPEHIPSGQEGSDDASTESFEQQPDISEIAAVIDHTANNTLYSTASLKDIFDRAGSEINSKTLSHIVEGINKFELYSEQFWSSLEILNSRFKHAEKLPALQAASLKIEERESENLKDLPPHYPAPNYDDADAHDNVDISLKPRVDIFKPIIKFYEELVGVMKKTIPETDLDGIKFFTRNTVPGSGLSLINPQAVSNIIDLMRPMTQLVYSTVYRTKFFHDLYFGHVDAAFGYANFQTKIHLYRQHHNINDSNTESEVARVFTQHLLNIYTELVENATSKVEALEILKNEIKIVVTTNNNLYRLLDEPKVDPDTLELTKEQLAFISELEQLDNEHEITAMLLFLAVSSNLNHLQNTLAGQHILLYEQYFDADWYLDEEKLSVLTADYMKIMQVSPTIIDILATLKFMTPQKDA